MFFKPLPKPPSLAELDKHIPKVEPAPEGGHRPFWSVMIPAYNCGQYLRTTLESVLAQDPGREEMQIEVIDDCSTHDDSEPVVNELGRGRVAFYRNPRNLGATETFNVCLNRSNGQWIHILHGDDMVRPGFFEIYRRSIEENPDAVMVVGRVILIDESDEWQSVSPNLPCDKGPLSHDFAEYQSMQQFVLFPGTIVRRDVYEKVGGFCSYFDHVADWDMWFRVARQGPTLLQTHPYALYRVHQNSDTNKLARTGINMLESYLMITVNAARMNCNDRQRIVFARRGLAEQAFQTAWAFDFRRDYEGRLSQAEWAFRLRPNWRFFKFYVKSLIKHSARSVLSRLKAQIGLRSFLPFGNARELRFERK